MSWTYAFLYVVEFVTAPTFMVGFGAGVVTVSVMVFWTYGAEFDRLRGQNDRLQQLTREFAAEKASRTQGDAVERWRRAMTAKLGPGIWTPSTHSKPTEDQP